MIAGSGFSKKLSMRCCWMVAQPGSSFVGRGGRKRRMNERPEPPTAQTARGDSMVFRSCGAGGLVAKSCPTLRPPGL